MTRNEVEKAVPIGPRWWLWAVGVGLAAAYPFFLFPRPTSHRLLWLLPTLVLPAVLARPSPRPSRFLSLTIFVLLALTAATTLYWRCWDDAESKLLNLVYGIAVFLVVTRLLSGLTWLKVALWGFIVSGAAFSALCAVGAIRSNKGFPLVDVLYKSVPSHNFGLPLAEYGFNSNAVAGVVLLFLPAIFSLLALYFAVRQTTLKAMAKFLVAFVFLGLFLLVETVAFLMSQSYGAAIALTASSAVVVVFWGISKKKKMAAAVCILLMSAVGSALAWQFVSAAKQAELVERTEKTTLDRVVIWKLAWPQVVSHPWAGVGFNRFRYLPGVGYETAHAHNHLLHTAVELGIPAAGAMLTVFLSAFYMAGFVFARSPDRMVGFGALGLGWGQLAHFIFGFGDSIPLGAKPGIVWWVSLALIAAMYNWTCSSKQSINRGIDL